MNLIYLPELVAFGIILGTMYALVAIGLSMIFGVCRVVNIAHGEFVMLGAYITFWSWALLNINPIVSLAISMPILFIVGLFLGRVAILRISGKGLLASLMLTFGISIFMWNTAEVIFTPIFRSVDYLVEPITLGPVTASKSYFAGFVLAFLLLIIFFSFLKFSRFGKAIRATTQNRQAALACGIDVKKVESVSFALAALLAGACGTIVSMVWTISPQMGMAYLSKSFAIVVIGGLGSIPGAFLGAYIFGIAESVGTQFLTIRMAQVLPFAIIILILVVKRGGLLSSGGTGHE
jgi:branched-chain amino acid transport system permease protein